MTGMLGDLEAYVRAVDSGSFSAAARQLGITPSAVSRSVARLEAEFGVALLTRSTRALHVTDEGRALHARAAQILQDLLETRQALEGVTGRPAGRLRIDAPFALGRIVIAPRIPEFLGRYEGISLELSYRDHAADLIGEGIDLAIRIGELADSSSMARRLGALRMVACASPGYLERHGTPREPADLARHNCLGFLREGRPSDWYLGPKGALAPIAIRGSYHTNDGETLLEAARAGVGIVWVLDFLVASALERGDVIPVLEEFAHYERPVHAVYPASRHLLPKMRVFLDFASELLRRS